MKFAIVQFRSGAFDLVPTSWLVTDEVCWWPPKGMNVRLAASKEADPDPISWTQHMVTIMRYKGTVLLSFENGCLFSCVNFFLT